MQSEQILPGATICILGDGQLGKMSLQAAHQLGYHTMVWYPSDKDGNNGPAMEMATHRLRTPFDCPTTIDEVVRYADVITVEWENAPLSLAKKLERRGKVVRPSSRVLEVAQSRIREKMMARQLDIPTTKTVDIPAGAINADGDWSDYLPGILKTDGLGYDGKGQWSVSTVEELVVAHQQAGVDCVLEKRVDLDYELSVLVARTARGEVKVSHVVENKHQDGILDGTTWPVKDRGFTRWKLDRVQGYAMKVAEHLDLEGVLCLEFFVDRDGNTLFNEMAPRPHNSFHGSIEAANTSQFEQHIRAICGLPLGYVDFHTPFVMRNLIGGTWEQDWGQALDDRRARLHLYGKKESRNGRKMGHVTRLGKLVT
jgi:5-(carboxyamino)imidazole ribonucleotide synthase